MTFTITPLDANSAIPEEVLNEVQFPEIETAVNARGAVAETNVWTDFQSFQKSQIKSWWSPAQITANQNNYAGNAAPVWRLYTDASRNMTGIAITTDGVEKEIHNIGAFDIVFAHQSGSSTAANRFILPGNQDFILSPGFSVTLRYDGATGRWRMVARSAFRPLHTDYSSSTTIDIPPGARFCDFDGNGAGAGGGSGRRGAALSARFGGGGGTGGARNKVRCYTAHWGGATQLTVTIAAGGSGGAAQTVNDSNGATPSNASVTSVTLTDGLYAGQNVFRLSGGNGGSGGTAAAGTGGTAPNAMFAPATGGAGAAGAGANATASPAAAGSGGGGGGISAGDAPGAGGNGALGSNSIVSGTAPAGGTVPGGAGTAATLPTSPYDNRMGDGGAGGAGSITGVAGTGGNGIKGGGGGGGGASLNGNNSGAGGAGGDAFVMVDWL